MIRKPKVSVIIPIYNVEKYLKETLESVSGQRFADFEIVVVDDGSSDQSAAIVDGHNDRRLRLIRHEQNRGVAAARNTGLDNAVGEFVALLDGDDVAHPLRLLKQVEALECDSRLGLIGSQVAVIDECGRPLGVNWPRPTDENDAAIGLICRNTFSACFMFRRAAFVSGMFGSYPMSEDYYFVSQIAANWVVRNASETLTTIRVRKGGLTHTKRDLMEKHVRMVSRDQIRRLGIEPSASELDTNRHVGALTMQSSMGLLNDVDVWLQKLVNANDRCGRFDSDAFRRFTQREWLEVCRFSSGLGMKAYRRYWDSPFARIASPTAQGKFIAKCALRHRRPGGDYPFT